jgi:hypothetical protein
MLSRTAWRFAFYWISSPQAYFFYRPSLPSISLKTFSSRLGLWLEKKPADVAFLKWQKLEEGFLMSSFVRQDDFPHTSSVSSVWLRLTNGVLAALFLRGASRSFSA